MAGAGCSWWEFSKALERKEELWHKFASEIGKESWRTEKDNYF